MKYIVLKLTTLLLGCFFYGQQIIVKDEITLLPLEAVVIKSLDDKNITATNYLGMASLPESIKDSVVLVLDKFETKKVSIGNLSKSEQITFYLKPEIFRLQSTITTGTQWKTQQQKSPIYINALTEPEVLSLNQATIADVLSQTHEIYIQKSQLGGGSPMMRGFATNRLLINVDGVNMNNAIFRSGNLQNIIAIDPFTLKNIEVINGPASVLYGSDAIGGVLSFETKSALPTEEFNIAGDITARYASAMNEKTMHADIEISMPKFSSLSSISHTNFDDLKMGKNGPDDYLRTHYIDRIDGEDVLIENENPRIQRFTGYHQTNLLQKFRYQPTEAFYMKLTSSYSVTSDVPRYDRLLVESDEGLRSAEWYYGPQEWLFTTFRADLKTNKKLFDHFGSILSHQYFTESRHNRNFNSSSKRNNFERVNLWSWENSFRKQLNPKNQLNYGFAIKHNHVNSSGNREDINTGEKTPAASRYPNSSNWNQYGVYAKLKTEIHHHLHLVSGLRYSWVESKSRFSNEFYDFPFDNADFSTSAWTGKFGVHYTAFRQIVLNAQFSTGFRAPNIDDIGKVFDSQPGSVVIPNPDLKPEYIYNLETGISKSFGHLFYIHALAYYSWLEDAFVRRDFTLNGETHMMYDGVMSQIQAIQNAAAARVYGGLIQMEMNLRPDLKLLGKINYTRGEEELDDGSTAPLRHAAPLFGHLGMEYEKNRWKAELHFQFNGEIKAEDMPPTEIEKPHLYALNNEGLPYSPAWETLDFSTHYKLSDHINLNFRIDNIFNKLYRPYSSGISAPGRNFVLSVRTTF